MELFVATLCGRLIPVRDICEIHADDKDPNVRMLILEDRAEQHSEELLMYRARWSDLCNVIATRPRALEVTCG